ncbi:hypothetical protein KKH27_05615 [bacterium]|nr:hypothetical protein [bacterium]MBU1984404.1 hypothetical protein [bacterium]
MHTYTEKLRIVSWEVIGFGLVVVFLWLDEIFDLPHYLLGAPATPINWSESLLETAYIFLLAFMITRMSRRILRRLRYLEAFLRVCSHCHRVLADGAWVPMEQYLGEQAEIRVSRGLCPDCEKNLYSS